MATLREFHEAYPAIPAVMLLDSPKREIVLDAFRAGARGIFSKHESLETLCKCVRAVYEGQVWASSREIKFALEALSSAPTIRAINAGGLNLLSRRELQVVHYLAEGLTNREIGARLGLSRHTIKNYLLKIFDKLGVSNRVELLFLTLSQPTPVMHALDEVEDIKKV
jgi:DNA-binding NarL/FixJ family response regulator